ncbi:MAG: hypothetical protein JST21_18785, partial [Bacteroidetes bacterium]|nr:hypothetical protein [Bacteroidota bacterium]
MKIQTAEFKQQMHLNHSAFVGIKYRYFYQQIELLQQEIGFDTLPVLVRNLATIRIFEPASKLRSIDLMAQYFDV